MVKNELNVNYKKTLSFIDGQFQDEIYSEMKYRFQLLEDDIIDKINEYLSISQYRLPVDFSIRNVDINRTMDDARYDFVRDISSVRTRIVDTFQTFYVSVYKLVSSEASEEDKKRLLSVYLKELKDTINSLYNNISNSLEFFDVLDRYFKNHSGDEDFSYEMHSFLKIEKDKIMNSYLDKISYVLRISIDRVYDVIKGSVLPALSNENKEIKNDDLPVSKLLEDGSIISAYLGVDISKFGYNKELFRTIPTLIHTIVYFDLYRDKNSANNLWQKSLEACSACKKIEDVKNLDELLKELSDKGGYASKVYPILTPMLKKQLENLAEEEKQGESGFNSDIGNGEDNIEHKL